MLEASWESYATAVSNAPTTNDFVESLQTLIRTAKVDLSKPSRVVYARDTRPSGLTLVSALRDGLKAIGADARDAGVTTTPILHYLVKAINTKDTSESYGPDSEEGYYEKLSNAFKNLIVCVMPCGIQYCFIDVSCYHSRQELPSHLYLSTVPTELVHWLPLSSAII